MSDNYYLRIGESPVLIHAPHGALDIPKLAYDSLIISKAEIKAELLAMTDRHTGLLANDISNQAYLYGKSEKRAGLMINWVSRLAVDPERFPDEREEMNAVGMGAVYTHGSQRQRIRADDPVLASRLVDEYFTPYAAAMENAVEEILHRFDRAFIVDLHSYPSVPLPYELHADGERPDICLGFDDFHMSSEIIDMVKDSLETDGYSVGFNSPFAGTYVPLKFYATDARVSSLMLEIRRDIYMNEKTGNVKTQKYERLLQSLGKIIDILNDV